MMLLARNVCLNWMGCLVLGALIGLSSVAVGQNPPVNSQLVGRWNEYLGAYSEATSDGNYIYGGNFARGVGDQPARVFVIDITDPMTPTLANEVLIPAPNNDKSPEDVMLAPNGLLFVAMETSSAGADAVAIFDARNPPALPQLATVRLPSFQSNHRAHNVQWHEGYMYFCDSSTPRVAIVDLTTFDPDNPPVSPITTEKWIINGIGASFVHEMLPITLPAPYGKVLYCAAWNGGVHAYDINNVATTLPTLLGSAPGNSTHSMWPTDDGKFVVSGEERSNGGIKVWEVTVNTPTSWSFTLKDELVLSTDAFSVHNQAVVGHRLYNSWYQAGMQVHDIDPVTGLLTFVASYDTSSLANNGTFAGDWSVFPFLGEDKIILSDLEQGYFVVELEQTAFFISLPNGPVDHVDPQNGAELRVATTPGATTPDPSAATLFVSVDNGPFTPIAMTQDVNGDFLGQFGARPCGSIIEYYVAIDGVGGGTVLEPLDAPTTTYSTFVYDNSVLVVNYNFENAAGWAVSGDALDGQWTPGVPAGDGTRGDPLVDYDGSGSCYLTDNVPGNSDVDSGTTTLTSPTLNMSGLQDPVLSYARWYSNSAGQNAFANVFVVEISNNNGGSWVNLETVGPAGGEVSGGWFFKEFKVADVIVPTASMKVRFSASDFGIGAVVEAAVDAVSVRDFTCDLPTGSCCESLVCTGNVTQPQCAGVFREAVDCTTPCPCIVTVECDDSQFCNGAETCVGGDCIPGTPPCVLPAICNEATDACETPPAAPSVVALGSRYLGVTPAVGTEAVALRISSVVEPCIDLYVQADGSLAGSPVYRTPAQWGATAVFGPTVLPLKDYNVKAETPGSLQSLANSDVTWKWGDVDDNALVNLDDLLIVIQGFGGNFGPAALEAQDQMGCNPNGAIDIDDLLAIISAFGGGLLNCPDPCP